MTTRILLDLADGLCVARPTSYLGETLFAGYRAACEAGGARYDRDRKKNTTPLDDVPRFVLELQRAGFDVRSTPSLSAAIQARAAAQAQAARDAEGDAEARAAAVGRALWPFQVEGARRLAEGSLLLADPPGLGKTIEALVALPVRARALVICPAIVKGNWCDEIARWRPDLRAALLRGHGSLRWPEEGEFVVTNYDILDELEAAPPAGVVLIADEGHALKTARAKRTIAFRALSEAVRAHDGRVWILTGTPLLNRPPELWHVLEAAGLARRAFGGWKAFVALFGGHKGRFGYEWGGPAAEVPELLRPVMLRRRREEVLAELPPKRVHELTVELDSATRKLCDEAEAALAARGLSLEQALDEVEAGKHGAGFDELSRLRAALAAAKTPHAVEWVEQAEDAEDPVLVFSAHLAALEALASREGWELVTGGQSPEKRSEIVRRFQAGELRGLAISIAAGGIGITLTRACRALFVDLAWTPGLNAQAEDRIYRIGQSRGVEIVRLVADHAIDRRVLEILDGKARLIEQTIDAATVSAPKGDRPAPATAPQLALEVVPDLATKLARKYRRQVGPPPGETPAKAAPSREGDDVARLLALGWTMPEAAPEPCSCGSPAFWRDEQGQPAHPCCREVSRAS